MISGINYQSLITSTPLLMPPTLSQAQALDTADPLAPFRDRFVIADPGLIYLDGNSLGRLSHTAAERLQQLINYEWGSRLIRSWNEGWFDLPEKVGAKAAQLLGAEADEVIIADSTSVNLFKLALAAVQIQNGRTKIITDDLNFPSDLYILQGVARLAGSDYEVVRVKSADGLTGPVERLAEAVDENTALVSLTLTTFKSGYTYDLAAITKLAHRVGAMVLWDLSHSVGAIPIALNEAGVDLAVGCTYKYLNGGPGSPAFLYVRKDLQDPLSNPIAGWMGQESPFDLALDYHPISGIRRFLSGTPSVLALAAVEAGLDLVLEAGIEQIRAKSVRQSTYFIDLYDAQLAQLGFRLNSPRDPARRGSHVILGHDEGWRISQALIQEMNVLPDFRRPEYIRFGIAPLYTTFTELYTAVIRLKTVVEGRLYENYSYESNTVT
ncbi:MAG: kynureninase [Candidatus Promineifilaceae bacterium]